MELNTSELEEPDFSSELGDCISPSTVKCSSPKSCRTSDLDEDDTTSWCSLLNTSTKSDFSLDDYHELSLPSGSCGSPVGHSTAVESFVDLDRSVSVGCYSIYSKYSSDESQDENGKQLIILYKRRDLFWHYEL